MNLTATEIEERMRAYSGPIPGDVIVSYILDVLMELVENSTMHFFKDREDVARFVASRIRRLQRDSVSIITIRQEKSGGFSVSTATSLSSEDTQTPISSNGLDVT